MQMGWSKLPSLHSLKFKVFFHDSTEFLISAPEFFMFLEVLVSFPFPLKFFFLNNFL